MYSVKSSCGCEIRELHARRLTFSVSCEVGRCRKGKKERRRDRERQGEREGHSRPGEESTALHQEKETTKISYERHLYVCDDLSEEVHMWTFDASRWVNPTWCLSGRGRVARLQLPFQLLPQGQAFRKLFPHEVPCVLASRVHAERPIGAIPVESFVDLFYFAGDAIQPKLQGHRSYCCG